MTDIPALLARLDRDDPDAALVVREQTVRFNRQVLETYFVVEDYPAQKARAVAAEARVSELEARLEITHTYVANDDGNLTRKEVPAGERLTMRDGIECRDATIELLEEDVTELRAKLATARASDARAETYKFHLEKAEQLLQLRAETAKTQIAAARAETWEAAAVIDVPQAPQDRSANELGYLRGLEAYRAALRAKAKEARR